MAKLRVLVKYVVFPPWTQTPWQRDGGEKENTAIKTGAPNEGWGNGQTVSV